MNTFKPNRTTRMSEYKYHLVLSFEDRDIIGIAWDDEG